MVKLVDQVVGVDLMAHPLLFQQDNLDQQTKLLKTQEYQISPSMDLLVVLVKQVMYQLMVVVVVVLVE
jgi:hypothetical protein